MALLFCLLCKSNKNKNHLLFIEKEEFNLFSWLDNILIIFQVIMRQFYVD